jgi:hypothetical protein
MGMGGSSASSDPMVGISGIMQAQAAQAQVQLGQDWLAFSKEQFGIANERQKEIDEITRQVSDQQIRSMGNANQWAEEDRARWKDKFLPLQDKFIDKASNWDSAGKQAEAAAEAKADVQNAVAEQNAAAERAMAAQGVRPDSGAWAGTARANALGAGLASAGAQNTARKQLRNEAMALQGDALNIGSNLPSQAGSFMGTGMQAGNSAVGNNISNQNSWRANTSIMNTGYEGAMTGWNNSANIWRNVGRDRTDMLNYSDKMRAESMQGLMGGAGQLIGALPGLHKMMSSRDAKEDKREVRGVLEAFDDIPVEAWRYKEGEGDGGEHVGTYAEDFQRATGLGDGKSINIVDAIGVTMGAVKELAEKVEAIKNGPDGDKKPAPRQTAARKPASRSIFMEAA